MVRELVSSRNSKPFTEYVICVGHQGREWRIKRKYKHFCELHKALLTEFPMLKLPDSAKHVLVSSIDINNFFKNGRDARQRPALLEDKRKALELYLRDLQDLPIVRESTFFQRFVNGKANKPQQMLQSKRKAKLAQRGQPSQSTQKE